jgi:tRNA-specific 2-thiouridylase
MFPLGDYAKDEVREMAVKYDLPVFNKPDSQDLCFLGDGSYRDFLKRNASDIFEPGEIVNAQGETLGEHQGLPAYTIGQRRGLGIAAPQPHYVIKLEANANRLVVGTRDELGGDRLTAHSVSYISGQPFDRPTRVEAKIRYKARPVPATVTSLPDNRLQARLDQPLPDITPGQGFVFFQGERVLGGGIIER